MYRMAQAAEMEAEELWEAGCHREGWYFWCGKELKFIGPYPSFTHAFEAEQEKDDGGVY